MSSSYKHIDVTKNRTIHCSPLSKTCLFLGLIESDQLIREFKRGYSFFSDRTDSFHFFNEPDLALFLSFKSSTAYFLNMTALLKLYLIEQTPFHPFHCDHIITAVHEAYKNALLWSNLELESTKNGQPRPLDFDILALEKLQNPLYGNRMIRLSIYRFKTYLEFCITNEGAPIDWPEEFNKTSYTRGIDLIKSLSDHVIIDSNKQSIRLYFLYE